VKLSSHDLQLTLSVVRPSATADIFSIGLYKLSFDMLFYSVYVCFVYFNFCLFYVFKCVGVSYVIRATVRLTCF